MFVFTGGTVVFVVVVFLFVISDGVFDNFVLAKFKLTAVFCMQTSEFLILQACRLARTCTGSRLDRQ